MSLGCTVIIYPVLHRYQPEIQWYREGRLTTTADFEALFNLMFLFCTPPTPKNSPFLFCVEDVLLTSSKWNHMQWSGDRATLTLTHLNKEDEGLYTLRVSTKSGYETYSAYVFVRGGIFFFVLS